MQAHAQAQARSHELAHRTHCPGPPRPRNRTQRSLDKRTRRLHPALQFPRRHAQLPAHGPEQPDPKSYLVTGQQTASFDPTTSSATAMTGPGPSAFVHAAVTPGLLGAAPVSPLPLQLTSSSSHPTMQALAVTVTPLRIPDEDCAKAQFGGETFLFNKRNVPDPPAINFSKDLD